MATFIDSGLPHASATASRERARECDVRAADAALVRELEDPLGARVDGLVHRMAEAGHPAAARRGSSRATARGSPPTLEQPRALLGRAEHDRPGAEDPGGDGALQRVRVGGERHPRGDVRRHQPVLGDRDEQQVEEEALLLGRLAPGEQQVEVLGEREPAHEVAGEVAAAHLDAVRDTPRGDAGVSTLPRAPATIASSLRNASSRGRYFMPQSGATTSRSGGTTSSARRIRSATTSGVSASGEPRSSTPRTIVLSGSVAQHLGSRSGCAASSEMCVAAQSLSSREERVAARPVVDDRARSRSRCAAPCRRRCRRARGRSPRRRTRAPPPAAPAGTARRSGRRRRPRPSRSRSSSLTASAYASARLAVVGVVVVLRLLRHRERAGHGDLDPAGP